MTFDSYIGESVRENEPDPVVLVVPDVLRWLREMPSAMASTLSQRLEIESKFAHLGSRPLVMKSEDGTEFSERAVWSFLVELPEASDLVCNYVNLCIDRCSGVLPFCTEVDVLAQEPIYTFLDRHVRRQGGHIAEIPPEVHSVLNAFERFLNACDMDHEVHQDSYLDVVIGYLWSNPDRRSDFVVFRLLNGQFSYVSRPLEDVIRRKGQLRVIVDKLLAQPDIGWQLQDLVLELCAVAYGSAEQPAQEVLAYCRGKTSFDERPQHDYGVRELNILRTTVDGWYCDKRRIPDHTGFHKYSPEANSWIKDSDA